MARNSRLRAFKNSVIYGGLVASSGAGRRLSLTRARSLGRATGRLAHSTLHRERDKALRNLAIAFPDLDDPHRRVILRDMFTHLGQSLFEIAWMPNLDRAMLEQTTIVEGMDHFQHAVGLNKGVVLFTGHCGNWEWMAAAIGLLGFRMNVIARELYDSRLNQFIVDSRGRHDVTTIGRGSTSSAKAMLQTLRLGEVLGVLIDQNIKAESAEIPFFGRPASTPIGPARLAIRAGATAIAGFIEREGAMQKIRFEAPIETSRTDDAVELTARLTRSIEAQIRKVPSQWVWMHDRWRKR